MNYEHLQNQCSERQKALANYEVIGQDGRKNVFHFRDEECEAAWALYMRLASLHAELGYAEVIGKSLRTRRVTDSRSFVREVNRLFALETKGCIASERFNRQWAKVKLEGEAAKLNHDMVGDGSDFCGTVIKLVASGGFWFADVLIRLANGARSQLVAPELDNEPFRIWQIGKADSVNPKRRQGARHKHKRLRDAWSAGE